MNLFQCYNSQYTSVFYMFGTYIGEAKDVQKVGKFCVRWLM